MIEISREDYQKAMEELEKAVLRRSAQEKGMHAKRARDILKNQD